MISIFVEAAMRALLAGLAVAMALRIFRVHNVMAQKAAWGLVLVSALAMPLLLPFTARLNLLPAGVSVVLPAHPLTLLEELQARIQAKSGSEGKFVPPIEPIPQSDRTKPHPTQSGEKAGVPRAESLFHTPIAHRATTPGRDTAFLPNKSANSLAPSIAQDADRMKELLPPAVAPLVSASPILLTVTLYCVISALFFVRICLGLFTTIRLWHAATPVPAHQLPRDAAMLKVRAATSVASPLTIGSAILLPADFATWDSEKLRIVLAHERSHVRQGDFYLQMLASLYAALVWFSPLGWWIKHELAELAEAISDRAAMREAASRTVYAQILLEFAAAPRRDTIGVAMARPGSLSRRIERLLNDHVFRQCFAGGRRAIIPVALVPLAVFACTTLIRVEAAAGIRPAALALGAAPTRMPAPAIAAAPTSSTASQLDAAQAPSVPETIQVGDQALLPVQTETPTVPAAIPEERIQYAEPSVQMISVAEPAHLVRMAPVMIVTSGRRQDDGGLSFDRTLSASQSGQLMVSTGSGDIHITRASGAQVHIHGHIHVSHGGSEEEARQIAANPPIEQSGDAIRVGQHQEHWHNISIDYQIEAPASIVLAASSGSGDIVDDGVGQNTKIQTGSGDIRASGLEGPFTVKTGSGNVTAEQTGHGDVVAETGSGDIELKDIHGGFHGQTGSGNIKASGTPSTSWNLQTGSGDIELSIGNAPATLDVSTGSGSVSTDHEMMVQGSFDRHHIRGNLNGGGPTIRAQTGSGEVRIH